MEMKHKNINHARNVWDRAITLLPRVSQFWYKYIYMEDVLGNYAGARQLFERWMEWEPDEQAWNSYIKFELRNGEVERARQIYQRFVESHPNVRTWIRYAKFEERQGELQQARQVFEKAVEYLGELANDEELFIAFAQFEERTKEYERARAIYKYALDHIPKTKAQQLYKMFISFEKQYGEKENIEEVIISRRRFQYEEELKHNSKNYDVWFDYIRLEEAAENPARIREVFERAIANLPPTTEKRFWRRYIYLWINYALYEELEANDLERARAVYKECLRIVPHSVFSFSKLWIYYAKFELRQKQLAEARSILGHAIGIHPKEKVFEYYIDLEMNLANIDRCRTLYQKYLETFPNSCRAWLRFASFERDLGENKRARAIFELAIDQPLLDMPENVWKAYIDFEIANEKHDRVRQLYERLLQRTKHVKVWISYAQFEHSTDNIDRARAIFKQANDYLKSTASGVEGDALLNLKEERLLLVQTWKEWEEKVGEKAALAHVQKLVPKRIKKRRPIQTEQGTNAGWEEYWDYIFPDEQAALPNLKILERAHRWKSKLQQQEPSSS
ncbi:Crooked neck-like protein 1, variant 2 [Balamuthia mandrillaris]